MATAVESGTKPEIDGQGPGDRVTVASVDDQPILLLGIAALFAGQAHLQLVGTGTSADGAVAVAARFQPDVMTLDLSVPHALEVAIRSILDVAPRTRIIIFTANGDVDLALRALDAGAHGFVLKGRPPEDLFEAIEVVQGGSLYFSPDIAPKLVAGFRRRSQYRDYSAIKLSPRERQLVDCLFEGKSNKEIARKLDLTEKTVKHYMTNLMNKLRVRSRLEVVLAAQRAGTSYSSGEGLGGH